MVRRIEWAERSRIDLKDIYDYIARDSKQYAEIQVKNIQNSIVSY